MPEFGGRLETALVTLPRHAGDFELVQERSGCRIDMNREPLCYGPFLRGHVTVKRKSSCRLEAVRITSEEAANARPEVSKMHHERLT
jgi:hypothetical protein